MKRLLVIIAAVISSLMILSACRDNSQNNKTQPSLPENEASTEENSSKEPEESIVEEELPEEENQSEESADKNQNQSEENADKNENNEKADADDNPDIKMTLSGNDNRIKSASHIVVTLKNNSDKEITTSYHYKIQKLEDDTWKDINLEFAVIEIALMLESGKEQEFEINLYPDQYDYTVGVYRVVKSVAYDNKNIDVATEFEII